ncbi:MULTISPECIES: dioxygenase family protein [Rhodanobacter]|uniref:dioxygenase family protein n=1 Tax=Rhodanobacter TaxID=75309 RepID=UPI000414147B|nr:MULTISPECIES: class III extradiol ring-cleavage dioxygenase [Rhodanobacter]KZC18734.1 dioxygenase [Rhodanobacter denitrificans]UJM93034.1 dioxygenase [Rhodanobacter denitrificans]UJM96564.1 dioxygenase [Rhodanobacter denitrificans]UJN20606.1 dioxygenase [Rhodanobacter denitrificans]
MTAPSIFISHGSPMFALEPGRLGPNLRAIGQSLHGITAVLVVSPHWQTRGVRVGASAAPETIHDFGGFPPPLYQLQYPVPGTPALAQDAARLLAQAGFEVALDERRGLDHGAWVPLRYLFPQADMPVFQVSLPQHIDAAGALRLGQALAPLRECGVLVVGSGSLTHNLYEFRQAIRNPEYAQQFVDWVRDAVTARDIEALVDYRHRAPHAERAHPTEEHYLPLLVAAGASFGTDATRLVEGGMTYGVLSMDSFAFGLPDAAHTPQEPAA